MTCAECEDYEYRRQHPLRWLLGGRMTFLAPGPLNALADVVSFAVSGQAPPTHYERHRQEYVRTGAQLEMERMLRQVRA